MKTLSIYFAYFAKAGISHLTYIMDNFRETLIAIGFGVLAWVLEFIGVYLFNDYKYLAYLGMAMFWNALTGIIKVNYLHKQAPDLNDPPSAKVFAGKTFGKILYYMVVLNSVHLLTAFQIEGKAAGTIFIAFQYSVLTTMIASEIYSIHENYKAVGRELFWVKFIENLRQYLPQLNKNNDETKQ